MAGAQGVEWHFVSTLGEIAPGEAKQVEIDDLELAVSLGQQTFEILTQDHAIAGYQVLGYPFPGNCIPEDVEAFLAVISANQFSDDLTFLDIDQ